MEVTAGTEARMMVRSAGEVLVSWLCALAV